MYKLFLAFTLASLSLGAASVIQAKPECCKTKEACCADTCCKAADHCCKDEVRKPCAKTCAAGHDKHPKG